VHEHSRQECRKRGGCLFDASREGLFKEFAQPSCRPIATLLLFDMLMAPGVANSVAELSALGRQ